MSQHDFNIANQSFPATRTDLNNALQALASNSSGDAEPSTTFANQWWYETDTNTLKLRNEANNAWLSFATVDQTTGDWTLAHDVDITGTLTATALVGDITGDVTGNLTGNVTGNINGLTPQVSNMQPFNRIINGAMTIDQRNAGASVTQNATGLYTLDRWSAYGVVTSKFTIQQNAGSVTPPVGFKNYLGCTSSSAYSLTSGDLYIIQQNIEGYNIADLGWGTVNAKTITLSFWVYSSLTGTFGGSITGSNSRNYPFSYSVSVANTWTQISITIAGDTSGTWGSTNGNGILVNWSLGTGSNYSNTAGSWTASASYSVPSATSVVGTSGATFYITGVQLEAGSTASPFAHENYGDTLQKCQRYFTKFQTDGTGFAGIAVGTQGSTTESIFAIGFPVQMRVEPTCAISNLDVSDVVTYSVDATLGGFFAGYQMGQIRVTHSSAGAQFRPATLNIKNNTTGFLSLSAEL